MGKRNLGLSHTSKSIKESPSNIGNGKVDAKVLFESLFELLALVQAQDAVVDQDSGICRQWLPSSVGQQECCRHLQKHRRAPGGLTNKGANASNFLLKEVGHCPVRFGANSVVSKCIVLIKEKEKMCSLLKAYPIQHVSVHVSI